MKTIFYVPFDGENGATEWPEEINGLTPLSLLYEYDVDMAVLDTSQKVTGTASAKLCNAAGFNSGGVCYILPSIYKPFFDVVIYFMMSEWPVGADAGSSVGLMVCLEPTPFSTAQSIQFNIDYTGVSLAYVADGATEDQDLFPTTDHPFVDGAWYKFTLKMRDSVATLEIADIERCSVDVSAFSFGAITVYGSCDEGVSVWADELRVDGDVLGIPLLQVRGEVDSHQSAWLPSLSVSANIVNNKFINGTITLPLQVIYGSIVAGSHADFSQKIPVLRGGIQVENTLGQIYAREAGGSGAYFENKIPKVSLFAGATREGTANLSKAISRITLTSSAHTDTNGILSAAIPAVRISATGTIGQAASLSKPIPMVRLTASAIAGMIGSLQKSIPAVKIDANSYWLSGASLQKSIPAIRISARVEGILAEIIALALNTKNFGLSKYTSYPYNSLCVFNGSVVGAKSSGVYELSGSTDDGTAIAWKLRTPLINLDKNKLRNVWLHGTLSGDIKMIVETADGERYEYDAEPVSESDDAVRIKVGKGLDSRYVIIEFQNESDQSVTVDKIAGFGVKL